MGEISKLASTVKMLQEQLISAQKQNNKLLEQQEILKIELDLLKATRQQQSTCDQHSEEPTEPLETNFEEPLPDQQTSFMTPTVPLINKYEILEDHSEEDYQDIKVTEEYTLVQRSPCQTENNRQQERNPSITRHAGNNTSHQLMQEAKLGLDDTTKPQESWKPQTTPNAQDQPERMDKANTIILCDSNGKYLRLNKLCPNQKVLYHRCHTVTRGNEIINNLPLNSPPEVILIHKGTNDLDRSNTAELTSKIGNLITDTAKKFPSTKIVYSTLLPRRDVPFEEITKINYHWETMCTAC